MPVYINQPPIGNYVKWEVDQVWTRSDRDENYLFACEPYRNTEIPPGMLIGQITSGKTTVVADSGNTGDGVLTVQTLHEPASQIGRYVATCTDATTATAELWELKRPDGNKIGDVTTGVAFTSNELDITIADGATDWVVGDIVNIDVIYGIRPLDLTASNGLQTVIGINTSHVTIANNYELASLLLRGQAIVDFDRVFELYDNTEAILTSGQKTAILAVFTALDIIGD